MGARDTIGRHQNHPDVQRPWSQWSEDQTLYIAVPYSNPFRWRSRRTLLNNFRRMMARLPNVSLWVGELAYGDRPHEVTGMDEHAPMEEQLELFHHNDVTLRTDTEMFHKENIINAIIRRWPPTWKYGAWIDGDMIFTRHDWALETIHLLQHHEFVQLFSSYVDLDSQHQPYQMARSFAYNFLHQEEFKAQRLRGRGLNQGSGSGYHPRFDAKMSKFPFGYDPGAPGGGWAFRRSALDAVGGILDVNILGGGDSEMAHGLIGAVHPLMKRVLNDDQTMPCANVDGTPSHAEAVLRWQHRAEKLTGNIGYLEHHLVHPFHGSKQRRAYYARWGILREHDYNPFTDLLPDWQGIYRWSGEKPLLRDAVRKYFTSRTEDDPNLYGAERPML